MPSSCTVGLWRVLNCSMALPTFWIDRDHRASSTCTVCSRHRERFTSQHRVSGVKSGRVGLHAVPLFSFLSGSMQLATCSWPQR